MSGVTLLCLHILETNSQQRTSTWSVGGHRTKLSPEIHSKYNSSRPLILTYIYVNTTQVVLHVQSFFAAASIPCANWITGIHDDNWYNTWLTGTCTHIHEKYTCCFLYFYYEKITKSSFWKPQQSTQNSFCSRNNWPVVSRFNYRWQSGH